MPQKGSDRHKDWNREAGLNICQVQPLLLQSEDQIGQEDKENGLSSMII